MKFTNKIFDIEEKYYEENEQKGKLDRIDYTSTTYDGNDMPKHAYVYTPYGYDPEKKYEILYLVHGGGENAEKYLFKDGEANPLKRAIDNMIAWGQIEPIIIVTPSHNPYDRMLTIEELNSGKNPLECFGHELAQDLIPLVESKYHTFADFKTDAESLKAARDHRKLTGWSAGSVASWFTFMTEMAYFKEYGFMSGNCAVVNPSENTKEWTDATVDQLIASIQEQGMTKEDYQILGITGTMDIAFEKMSLQLSAMRAYPEFFEFEGENDNTSFVTWAKGEHHTQWRLQYTINVINEFYKK